jgi:polyhydroxyalkanoate synthesis regulator phasin
MNRITKYALAATLALAGLAGGAALITPQVAGAQEVTTTTTTTEAASLLTRFTEHIRSAIQGLVDDGTITAGQADAVAGTLASQMPFKGHRFGHFKGLDVVADTIGIEVEALAAELRAGSSIADVADANGVEPQAVIDALVAAGKERIDQAVADGRVSEEQAEVFRNGLTERVEALVNGESPNGRGFGRHGFGHPGGAQAAAEDTSA